MTDPLLTFTQPQLSNISKETTQMLRTKAPRCVPTGLVDVAFLAAACSNDDADGSTVRATRRRG